MTSACPSRLALDRFALGVQEPQVSAHVAMCDGCAAHVRRVSEPPIVPAWARELARTPLRRRLPRLGWGLGVGAGGLAAALAGWLIVAPDAAYVGTKGSAAAVVYVKRGDAVVAWDGRGALAPGDSIRLELAPTGFARAHVLGRAGSGWTTLWAGAVERKRATALPAAWRLDESAGPERLAIVAADAALSAEQASDVLAQGCPRAACVELTIPKAARDGAAPP